MGVSNSVPRLAGNDLSCLKDSCGSLSVFLLIILIWINHIEPSQPPSQSCHATLERCGAFICIPGTPPLLLHTVVHKCQANLVCVQSMLVARMLLFHGLWLLQHNMQAIVLDKC